MEQILNRIRTALGRFGARFGVGGAGGNILSVLTFGILGVAFIIWMGTGVYRVQAGEQGVLRTFGKVTATSSPGLNWHWPAPIGTRNVESVQEVRSMELGFSTRDGTARGVPEEALMIAGDLNIGDIQLVVQYRIKDLAEFLFKVADPGEGAPNRSPGIALGRPEGRTLKDVTEASLRLVVGQRPIDDVLIDKKEVVQDETQVLLQSILDRYETGIQILSVRLQEVKPPEEVRDAFDDVLRARQDKETLINQAEAYRQDIIPKAEGESVRIIRAAEGFQQQKIAEATGNARQFLAVLREYEKSKDVTRRRLYLEAMEDILPGISKFVVSPQAQGAIILNAGGGVVPIPQLSPTTTQPLPTTPTPSDGQ